MMSRRKEMTLIAAGMLAGAMLVPTAHAAVQQLTATPSTQKFYVDGTPVQMEAYSINGSNYVKLRDIGKAVGFDVSYDGTTNSVCIGERPVPAETVVLPADGSKYIPKAGDRVRCDDGYIYEVKDVSRWNNDVFAEGPVGELPAPTCDWSAFPEAELPKVEVRHFSNSGRETMWVRNLYETRRMQYTLYNALGSETGAWKNGKPLGSVSLTIPAEYEPITGAFWPWRASEVEKHVRNTPNAHFCVEAWDYYLNGVFQYTRYCIVTL